MKCENCKKEHNGSYGSGRFCSKECARGFSTKTKRKEINRKVSHKLSKFKKVFVKYNIILSQHEVKKIIQESRSMSEAAQKLNIPFSSFKRFAIDFGFYKPNQGWNKGLTKFTDKDDFIENYLQKNKPKPSKEILFLFGLKENKCECCGQLPIWNNQKLVFELHHKDGNKHNQELINLEILCPNCHSQTKTFRRRKRDIGE